MARRCSQASTALAIAAISLVLLSVLPLAVLMTALVRGDTLDVLGSTLGSARPWLLLGQTLGLAALVTLLALAVGVPMGVAVGKTDLVGRRWALLIHLSPVFVPPFLLALGWFHLLGRQGLVGGPESASLLFGPVGVVVTLGLAFAPIVTALTVLGLRGVDPSMEDAARTVARPWRAVTQILLPLAWPAIAFSALLVFTLAISELGVPMFLRVRTYPAAVFSHLGGVQYAPGEAAALVLPLIAVGAALLFIDRRLIGRRSFATVGTRRRSESVLPLGRYRAIVNAIAWSVAALSLLPFVGIASASGFRGVVDATRWLDSSLTTSLLTSAAGATLVTAIGLIAGHALARGRRGSRVLDAIALFAFVTPSAALGVGVVAVWNRPLTQAVYTSVAILVVGLSARYAVIGVRTLAAVFHSVAPHHEEAASSFGAGYLRRMTRILAPMRWRSIGGAWLIAFVFCMRDLDTVIAFYPPGSEPLPVRIFTLEANGPAPVVAGLSLIHILTTAVALTAGALLLRTRRRT